MKKTVSFQFETDSTFAAGIERLSGVLGYECGGGEKSPCRRKGYAGLCAY